MRHYPAFLDIAGRPCLVVGGGAAALAKVRLLQRAGADVTIVAPSFNGDIGADGAAKLLQRAFRPGDVQGHALVHAASSVAGIDEAADAGLMALLPGALKRRLAATLLGTEWFARRVVVDRWFLHRHQPALCAG